MRLLSLLSLLIIATALPARAEWTHEAGNDALATPATAHDGPVRPELVVVCNNMVTLTYMRWASDFGIDKKMLPNYVTVDFTLASAETPSTQTTRTGAVWTIARPQDDTTQFVTHDLLLPQMMTRSTTLTSQIAATPPLPAVAATFDLTGLQAAMTRHNLPCRAADKFTLKTEEQQKLEQQQAEERRKQQELDAWQPLGPSLKEKARDVPPPLPNFDPY